MKSLKTILQVEDDLNDVYLLGHALHKAEFECQLQVARDGKQAINYLQGIGEYADRATHPMPDLILLDLKLPRMMGLEVLEWIRRTLGNGIAVIVLTSSALESDIDRAYALGANAFLIKPASIASLQAMLKVTCTFWLTYNTPRQETTSQCPMEGVVSLDRLGRPCGLISSNLISVASGTQRTGSGFSI